MTTFGDKTLTCADCNNEFVFTSGEQEFYSTKGFQHEPKRCPACRSLRRTDGPKRSESAPGGSGGSGQRGSYGSPRRMYPAVCASCGQATEVPFEPKGIKPVYCSTCFSQQRSAPTNDAWQ